MYILDNTWARYNEHGDRIGFSEPGDRKNGDILSDISTSFLILIGIIFPSLTGYCVLSIILPAVLLCVVSLVSFASFLNANGVWNSLPKDVVNRLITIKIFFNS